MRSLKKSNKLKLSKKKCEMKYKKITPQTILNLIGKNIALVFAPDQKKINFSSSWLLKNAYDKKRKDTSGWIQD